MLRQLTEMGFTAADAEKALAARRIRPPHSRLLRHFSGILAALHDEYLYYNTSTRLLSTQATANSSRLRELEVILDVRLRRPTTTTSTSQSSR